MTEGALRVSPGLRVESIALTGEFRAKQLAVKPPALPVDLVRSRTQTAQHRLGHRQGHLAFAREHVLGAGAAQFGHIPKVRAACEHAVRRWRQSLHLDGTCTRNA